MKKQATAPFTKDLARLDRSARAALLEDEESTPLYVEHHSSELPPAKLKALFGAKPPSRAAFLAKMVLVRVALTPGDAKRFATFDYTLPKDVTNYLLVVTFDAKGTVKNVAMES